MRATKRGLRPRFVALDSSSKSEYATYKIIYSMNYRYIVFCILACMPVYLWSQQGELQCTLVPVSNSVDTVAFCFSGRLLEIKYNHQSIYESVAYSASNYRCTKRQISFIKNDHIAVVLKKTKKGWDVQYPQKKSSIDQGPHQAGE